MKKVYLLAFAILCLGGFLGLAIFGGVDAEAKKKKPAAVEKVAAAWNERCSENEETKEKHCEIVQKLIVKETGQRMIEFAIPAQSDDGVAHAVVILPLGVLLPAGVRLTIDEKQSFSFDVRYCTPQGCVALVDLNEEVLGFFRKGEAAIIAFKAINGQDMAMPISLKGFKKAYKRLG